MIDELTFLTALTWLHWPQAPIRCRFTSKRSRSAIRATDCRFRSRRCFETIDRTISSNFPLWLSKFFTLDRSFFLSPFLSLFLLSFFSFFFFLFLLLTQFLTLLSHVLRNFSFETDQRVHLLFLRSMLHDRLTYKPRTMGNDVRSLRVDALNSCHAKARGILAPAQVYVLFPLYTYAKYWPPVANGILFQ